MLTERFAFCQTMPLDEFLTTAEGLRNSGYRPIRFRPTPTGRRSQGGGGLDPRRTPLADRTGLSADKVRQNDERNRKRRFMPVDVAGYVATDSDGKPTDRYAPSGWRSPGDDARHIRRGNLRRSQNGSEID